MFFVLLFPFWLLRKVGAGDVKLMAVAPLVAGGENMLTFAILLLVLAIVTVFAVRNPMLLPAPAFRQYLEHFERKGIVPFGVPIAGALIVTTVAKALNLIAA
jgi:prepilin peptidase CpaA